MFRYVPELAIAIGTNEALNFGTLSLIVPAGPLDITGWTWLCQARLSASTSTVLLAITVQTVGLPTLGQINLHAPQSAVFAAGVTGLSYNLQGAVYDLIGTPPGGEPWEAWMSDFGIVQGVSR